MPIIKERIKFENKDVNLKINLGAGNSLSGYQQEINYLTEETKVELTNPIIDNEVRRFQYSASTANLFFYFTVNGVTYVNEFGTTGARFESSEITDNSVKTRNSFFIMDFYDTYNTFTQTKIFTIYQTKILSGVVSSGTPIPKYIINNNNNDRVQFYSWYVPKTFIDQNIASGLTTVTGYVKFSFFNAKYGDIALFYNKDYVNPTNPASPERLYFKVKLDLVNMTWKFDYSGTNYPPNAKAYQIPFTNAYSQKVNDGVNNFENKKQNYPEDNTFDAETGNYYETL